jgi:hypothetical protein
MLCSDQMLWFNTTPRKSNPSFLHKAVCVRHPHATSFKHSYSPTRSSVRLKILYTRSSKPYLSRMQLFVLDTYTNSHNRTVNYSMMIVGSYMSVAFSAFVALGTMPPFIFA